MNVDNVIKKLQEQYPGKAIIKNSEDTPTEILCEVEPTQDHPDYSIAIAVIDRSIPHYHKVLEERYEVIEGELELFIDGQSHSLKAGESFTIKPGSVHYAAGNETWITVSSKPGWTIEDHIIVSDK